MRTLTPPLLLRRAVLCFALSLPVGLAHERDLRGESLPDGPEGQLHRALELVEGGHLDAAIREMNQLVSKYP